MSATAGIPEAVVREHIARLCELMKRDGLNAVIVFHPSNMAAFTGTPHSTWDRLTCGAITRDGEAIVVCPAFEQPGIDLDTRVPHVHTWEEHEDAYALLAQVLARLGVRSGRIGVDGRMWLDAWARFQAAFEGPTLCNGEALLREVRICKSPAELELMRAAHRRGEQVFLELRRRVRPGVTERQLAREIKDLFEPRGLLAHPMVQTGPNGAAPHHAIDDTPLAEGHTVVIDSVTVTSGYHNDLTRTYAVGSPGARARQAYRAVRAAQAAAIAAARPGVPCQELDRAARKVITDAGFGPYFVHRLGHGIGSECHEPPYLVEGNAETLRAGMCVTIEPGIYVPGEFGIRIEDDVAITPDGCEVIRGELPTDVTTAYDA